MNTKLSSTSSTTNTLMFLKVTIYNYRISYYRLQYDNLLLIKFFFFNLIQLVKFFLVSSLFLVFREVKMV